MPLWQQAALSLAILVPSLVALYVAGGFCDAEYGEDLLG